MKCSYCGHEQVDSNLYCEKCGANIQQQQWQQQQQNYDPYRQPFSPYQPYNPYGQYNPEIGAAQSRAQTSMILGILSVILCCIGIFCAIPALVMGLNSKKTLTMSNVQEGQGQATAGIVLSIISLIIFGFIFFVYFISNY